MKLKSYFTSLDAERKYPNFSKCGYTNNLVRHFEKYGNMISSDIESADIIVIFVTFLGTDYTFDNDVADLISKSNKPIIIFDYTEYGPYNGHIRIREYNLYGYKIEFNDLKIGNSDLMQNFLLNNQKSIRCYFKRELSSTIDLSIVPFKVFPIEFISDDYVTNTNPDSKDEYYDRRCIYNFVWGFSNYSRPRLHGSFLLNMEKFQSIFALSHTQVLNTLKTSKEKFIFLSNHDWYERVDLNDINSQSMMVLDLYGCGQKCFRNVESTKNSLSVKQDPNKLIFSYEWKHEHNCIILPVNDDLSINLDKSIELLLDYRHDKRHLLYDMYLNSLETNRLYSPKNYIPNCIYNNIKNNI